MILVIPIENFTHVLHDKGQARKHKLQKHNRT